MMHSNLLLAAKLAELHYRLDASIWRYLRIRLDDEHVFTQTAPSDWHAKSVEASPFETSLTYLFSVIHRDVGPNELTKLYLNRQLMRPVDFIQAISDPVPNEQYKRRVSRQYFRELNRLIHLGFDELPASLQLLYVNEAMLDVTKLFLSTDLLYLYPNMAEFIRRTED
jgi:hypothetical protein